jgi:hypothetical protein
MDTLVKAAQQSQVAERMMKLTEFCDELHKAIETLEKSLETVLRGQEPSKSLEEKNPVPTLVDLAQRLDERAENIKQATRRIADIRQRLEL